MEASDSRRADAELREAVHDVGSVLHIMHRRSEPVRRRLGPQRRLLGEGGAKAGVYLMLRMPEGASGEVFWRFYPLGDTAHPVTSPNDVLDVIAAARDTLRHEPAEDINRFSHLRAPLEATVNQIGEEYARAMAA